MRTLLEAEDIEAIVRAVLEALRPVIADNGKKDNDEIFDVQGLSEYLKVSKQWIYERTHSNEIPLYKVDGHLRFKKSDIDRWLQRYHIPAASMPSKPLKT